METRSALQFLINGGDGLIESKEISNSKSHGGEVRSNMSFLDVRSDHVVKIGIKIP